jgi:hypothetical protein
MSATLLMVTPPVFSPDTLTRFLEFPTFRASADAYKSALMNVRIRFGPKSLSKNGQRRTNSRKIISARRVTSDLALDPD